VDGVSDDLPKSVAPDGAAGSPDAAGLVTTAEGEEEERKESRGRDASSSCLMSSRVERAPRAKPRKTRRKLLMRAIMGKVQAEALISMTS
jgi:hypothetical protein